MNSVLAEIYSTILPSAPYVLAAYVLVWLILFVYVFVVMTRLKKTERKIEALAKSLHEKAPEASSPMR